MTLVWGLSQWGNQSQEVVEKGPRPGPIPPPSATYPMDALENTDLEEDRLTPEGLAFGPPSDSEIPLEKREEEELQVYVVRRGDSLSSIAVQFDVEIRAIKEVNQISSNHIEIGQRLLIPPWTAPPQPQPLEEGWFQVRQGDTFWKIASELDIDLQDLVDLNRDIDPSKIRPGDLIQIPLH
ncbi:LysM peptidoglycan-binding domain-containing protein [bacterium]|nr:LysM peptidoglycan-binding domain-containing protein [bacterium]